MLSVLLFVVVSLRFALFSFNGPFTLIFQFANSRLKTTYPEHYSSMCFGPFGQLSQQKFDKSIPARPCTRDAPALASGPSATALLSSSAAATGRFGKILSLMSLSREMCSPHQSYSVQIAWPQRTMFPCYRLQSNIQFDVYEIQMRVNATYVEITNRNISCLSNRRHATKCAVGARFYRMESPLPTDLRTWMDQKKAMEIRMVIDFGPSCS